MCHATMVFIALYPIPTYPCYHKFQKAETPPEIENIYTSTYVIPVTKYSQHISTFLVTVISILKKSKKFGGHVNIKSGTVECT